MTWDELTEAYLGELKARMRSFCLCASYRQTLRRFQAFCAARDVLFVEHIKLDHILRYAHSIEEEGLKASTRYLAIGSIRRWLKWAAFRGHLLQNPAEKWQPRHPTIDALRKVPTEAQMLALLEAPAPDTRQGQRDQVLLEFLYGTGLRVQECADAILPDLDLCHLVFTVQCGKGGASRCLPIGPKLAAKLQDYLHVIRPQFNPVAGQMALFLDDNGNAMQGHSIANRLRTHSKKACGEFFSVHSIRHAYATHLLLGGAPIWALQRLLGHVSIGSTAIYTKLLAIDIQGELLRTHPRARITTRRPGKPTA